MASKDNQIVYSDTWNDYKKDDCTHIMSATKSVMSLLIGIAVDKGQIGSVDDKVLDYFPDYKVKRGEKTIQEVTIKHLLTMRAPYKCKGDPWTKVCSSDNWTYASLDFLGGRKGLTDEFNYQTVCLHILSGILNKVTNMITVDYANEYLFEPLGIKKHKNYYAETAEEHKAFTIGKTPKEDIWFCDPDGLGTPGYGLCMSAEDMAKIGLLCLNNGNYNGKQIIHKANMPINNKTPHYPKKTSTFGYDIIKDKRYFEDKFFLHLSFSINYFKSTLKMSDLNIKVNKFLYRNQESINIMGIDRGERNLIYITIIDQKGNILLQKSMNELLYKIVKEDTDICVQKDYHKILSNRVKERDLAKKSWGAIDSIKELKEGYLSFKILAMYG